MSKKTNKKQTKNNLITNEIYKQLSKPVPDEAIQQHPTKTYLSTIKAIYVAERLNDVFGVGRWTLKHKIIKETENEVLMKGRLILLDYDCKIPVQYGSGKITGKGKDLADGYKSAVTDILSKTASYIGVGIDVFKGKVKKINKSGETYKDVSEPKRPIPKGVKVDPSEAPF